jgi:hypothetical protein
MMHMPAFHLLNAGQDSLQALELMAVGISGKYAFCQGIVLKRKIRNFRASQIYLRFSGNPTVVLLLQDYGNRKWLKACRRSQIERRAYRVMCKTQETAT